MACIRCSGFMVPETAYDGGSELKTTRCINCGYREGDRLRNPKTGEFNQNEVVDYKYKRKTVVRRG